MYFAYFASDFVSGTWRYMHVRVENWIIGISFWMPMKR